MACTWAVLTGSGSVATAASKAIFIRLIVSGGNDAFEKSFISCSAPWACRLARYSDQSQTPLHHRFGFCRLPGPAQRSLRLPRTPYLSCHFSRSSAHFASIHARTLTSGFCKRGTSCAINQRMNSETRVGTRRSIISKYLFSSAFVAPIIIRPGRGSRYRPTTTLRQRPCL